MKGLRFALPVLSLISLAIPSFSRAQPAPPAPLDAGASYQFALAKLLAVEGSLVEALAAFEEAEKLAPDAHYVRLEHAQLLARMAQYARNPSSREDYLRKAAERVSAARQLAPGNLDVLRAVGTIYLDIASQTPADPAALATAKEALEEVRRRDPMDAQSLLTLGRLYLDGGDPAKAAEVFRELVTTLPQQRMAYAMLVEALLRAEKPVEAEEALSEILRFDPGSLEARLTLAELQGRRGDQDAVIATLEAAPEEVRSEPRLRRQLAWALYQKGDLQKAGATLEPLLSEAAGGTEADPNLVLLKGLILTAEGRNAEAAALLGKVHEAQPGNAALAMTVARALQRDGREEEAARVLGESAVALEREGKAEEAREVRLEEAQVYFDAKRWEDVFRALQPLLAAAPQDAPAVHAQAVALQTDALVQAKRFDEALALLGRQAPGPFVDSKRAEVMFRAGRDEEGVQQLAALAASADPATVLAAVQSYHRLERYQDSIPILERMVAAQPDLPIPRFLLGAAYERTGRKDQAVSELRRVVQLEPDFHAALNYLGYTFAEAGENLEEALTLVRRALSHEPDNGAYVDSLGWTYHRLGRHEEAREVLERATRLEPKDATLQEHLGDVYVALGQTERARDAYRRALELGDDDDDAEQVRRKLEDLGKSRR